MLINRKKLNASIIAMAFIGLAIAKVTGIIHVSFTRIATYLLIIGALYLILESLYSRFEVRLIMMEEGCLQKSLFGDFRRVLIICFAVALAGVRESLAYVLIFFAAAILVSLLGRLVLFFVR